MVCWNDLKRTGRRQAKRGGRCRSGAVLTNPGLHEVHLPCRFLRFGSSLLCVVTRTRAGVQTTQSLQGVVNPPLTPQWALRQPFASCPSGGRPEETSRPQLCPTMTGRWKEQRQREGPSSFPPFLAFLPGLRTGPRGCTQHAVPLPIANVPPDEEAAPSCRKLGAAIFYCVIGIVKPSRNSSILRGHCPWDGSDYNKWRWVHWEENGDCQKIPLLSGSKLT